MAWPMAGLYAEQLGAICGLDPDAHADAMLSAKAEIGHLSASEASSSLSFEWDASTHGQQGGTAHNAKEEAAAAFAREQAAYTAQLQQQRQQQSWQQRPAAAAAAAAAPAPILHPGQNMFTQQPAPTNMFHVPRQPHLPPPAQQFQPTAPPQHQQEQQQHPPSAGASSEGAPSLDKSKLALLRQKLARKKGVGAEFFQPSGKQAFG